jgi:uncharacterized protein (DUF1499 family)
LYNDATESRVAPHLAVLTTTMNATTNARAVRVVTRAERVNNQRSSSPLGRRALVFRGTALPLFLGSVLNFEGERPTNLGVGSFNGMSTGLSLCPPSPNCVGTADEFNDSLHYVPAWTYNDEEKIARSGAEATRTSAAQALEQLVDVVNTTDCDGFEATIVERKNDYLRVEYKSPFFGFVDDVEFWFPADTEKQKSRVEYRSASRLGQSDGDANRKRIKALRVALQKKYGWKSVGFS